MNDSANCRFCKRFAPIEWGNTYEPNSDVVYQCDQCYVCEKCGWQKGYCEPIICFQCMKDVVASIEQALLKNE